MRERNRITPTKISNGDSHDRSRVSTRAISAVPTSAPSMMASAGASSISPWATKELTSSAVALLLCTRAVTPIPAAKASGRRRTLRLSRRRRLEPYTRRMPVRTMCVPQMSRAMAERRLSKVSIVALLAILKAAASMGGKTAAQAGELQQGCHRWTVLAPTDYRCLPDFSLPDDK
ncbi:hypothetical protein D9M73_164420 [compost metagenome]